MQRVMDRGSRSINFVLTALVFNVVPTALEIALVAGIFAHQCGAEYAAVTLATLATYVGYTVRVTSWRDGIRKEFMRHPDGKEPSTEFKNNLYKEIMAGRYGGGRGGVPRRAGAAALGHGRLVAATRGRAARARGTHRRPAHAEQRGGALEAAARVRHRRFHMGYRYLKVSAPSAGRAPRDRVPPAAARREL
jgi:hypothetical protein